MPPKSKKSIWIGCERCNCTITSNDQKVHLELNCERNQVKCPYVLDGKLYTWLERAGYPAEGVPRDAVMMHPSAGSLLGAVIGEPVLLHRQGVPPLLKRMWPSRTSAPAAVILPASDLTSDWSSDDNKEVTVSILNTDIPIATHVNINIQKLNIEEDICDILKEHFNNQYVSVGSILIYYYFGKKLEITITDIKSKELEDSVWFLLSSDTRWSYKKEEGGKVKKKITNLGGIRDIVEEILTFIDISFNISNAEAKFQPTRGLLIYGHSGIGKSALCKYLINTTNYFNVEINGPAIFSKYFGETESSLRDLFKRAKQNEPSVIFVDEIDTICPRKSSGSTEQERRVTSAFVSLIDGLHEEESKVFILATTRKPESIDPMLRRFGRLDKEIEIPVPDRIRRKDIFYSLLATMHSKISEKDVESISDLAHGYVAADLVNLCTQASMKAIKNSREYINKEDLLNALTIVRPSAMRELFVEIPNVRWTDIGGQQELKLKLRQAVEWPLKHSESFKRLGIDPPGGVLLYGPPGCSKTMIARALATESGFNFLSIKGPELFSKWVGESERAVRDLFTKARQVAPSVIFFDEVDAIGGKRGDGDGVQERVLAQLLAELDGVVPLCSVTILAATNRPDRIDSALLRPGRLDRLIYVPLPDLKTRMLILELRLEKMSVNDDVDVALLAEKTEGFSGAEIHMLCNEAALRALESTLQCSAVHWCHFEAVLRKFTARTPPSLLEIYEKFSLGQRSC